MFYSILLLPTKRNNLILLTFVIRSREIEISSSSYYGEPDPSKSVESILQTWEQIKLKEKDGNKTVLSGVPSSLPSLIKAYRIQEKARNVGFDWEQKEDAWDKVL